MTPSRLSAIVLLPTEGGALADEEVVASNVRRLRPVEGADESAREHFKGAGFDVGPTVGGAFAISGEPELFERHFDLKLERGPRGWHAGGGGDGLPLRALPKDVAELIRAIGLEAPPDFGPGASA